MILPLSVKDYGTVIAVRLQRATHYLLTVDTPTAVASTIQLANAGVIATGAGLWSDGTY